MSEGFYAQMLGDRKSGIRNFPPLDMRVRLLPERVRRDTPVRGDTNKSEGRSQSSKKTQAEKGLC